MKKLILALLSFTYLPAVASEIALTFDAAPRGDGHYFTGEQRTKVLLKNLHKAEVKQVAFYCNTFEFTANKKTEIFKKHKVFYD